MKRNRLAAAVAAATAGPALLLGVAGCTTVTNLTDHRFETWEVVQRDRGMVLEAYKLPYKESSGFTIRLTGLRRIDYRVTNRNTETMCAELDITSVQGDLRPDAGRLGDGLPIAAGATVQEGHVDVGRGGGRMDLRFHGNAAYRQQDGSYSCTPPGEPCYITTAMCEQTGKPDDCRELEVLRAYRDRVLAQTGEGRKLIGEYYRDAPRIVAAIDRDPRRGAIYRELREHYILPAAQAAERGANAEALRRYSDMVKMLRDRYLQTSGQPDTAL